MWAIAIRLQRNLRGDADPKEWELNNVDNLLQGRTAVRPCKRFNSAGVEPLRGGAAPTPHVAQFSICTI
jgi:hypothetical protein